MNGFELTTVPKEFKLKEATMVIQEPRAIEMIENRIYFYSEINRTEILQLNKSILQMRNAHITEKKVRELPDDTVTPIYLHLSSYGGDIFAGVAGMDEILKTVKSVPVYTIIDGCCSSAATFLSVVGTRRFINSNAYMLIHPLSSGFWGTYSEFEDEQKNLHRFMEMMKGVYGKYANIPESELDNILKHDLWFDAQKCLEYGLVDEIIGDTVDAGNE